MNYLNTILLEDNVKNFVTLNDDIIEDTVTTLINNNSLMIFDYVNTYPEYFIVEENLTATYDNIASFTEEIIVEVLEEVSDIISDPFASNDLKYAMLEVIDIALNTAGAFASRAGNATMSAAKAGYSYAGPEFSGAASDFYKGDGPKKAFGLDRKSPKRFAVMALIPAGFLLWWQKENAIRTLWNQIVYFDFLKIRGEDDIIRIPTGTAPTDPATIAREVGQITSANYEEVMSQLRERLADAKDAAKSASSAAELGDAGTQLENVKKWVEEMSTVMVNNDIVPKGSAILKSLQNHSKETSIHLKNVNSELDKMTAELTQSGVIPEALQNAGMIGSAAAIAGILAYQGYIKYKDKARILLFDRKLNSAVKQISKLGSKEIHKLQENLLSKKQACMNNNGLDNRDEGNTILINLKPSVKCYVSYASSMVVTLATIYLTYLKSVGEDTKNINSINSLLQNKSHKPMLEIINRTYDSYLDLLSLIIKDTNKKTKLLNMIDKQLSLTSKNIIKNKQFTPNNKK